MKQKLVFIQDNIHPKKRIYEKNYQFLLSGLYNKRDPKSIAYNNTYYVRMYKGVPKIVYNVKLILNLNHFKSKSKLKKGF